MIRKSLLAEPVEPFWYPFVHLGLSYFQLSKQVNDLIIEDWDIFDTVFVD